MPIWIEYEIEGIKNTFVISHDKVILHKVVFPDGKTIYELKIPDVEVIRIAKEEFDKIEMQLDTIYNAMIRQ